MSDLTPETLAELRRELDDMRGLALREGVYNGNRAVLSIIERVEPLLDAAADRDALAAKLAEVREWIDRRGVNVDDRDAQRHALHDANELRALLDATPDTGGES